MYTIEFYKNSRGEEPVRIFIEELKQKASKDKIARNRVIKINAYLTALQEKGTSLGMPVIRYFKEKELYELRPNFDRIFFFMFEKNSFVLLHQFEKQSNKTPKHELEVAIRRMKKYMEEIESDE